MACNMLTDPRAVPPPAMEGPLRGTQEAERACDGASRPSGQLFWLDTTTMEDHGGAGSSLGWPGRIRILGLLQNGHQVPRGHAFLRTGCNQARA